MCDLNCDFVLWHQDSLRVFMNSSLSICSSISLKSRKLDFSRKLSIWGRRCMLLTNQRHQFWTELHFYTLIFSQMMAYFKMRRFRNHQVQTTRFRCLNGVLSHEDQIEDIDGGHNNPRVTQKMRTSRKFPHSSI